MNFTALSDKQKLRAIENCLESCSEFYDQGLGDKYRKRKDVDVKTALEIITSSDKYFPLNHYWKLIVHYATYDTSDENNGYVIYHWDNFEYSQKLINYCSKKHSDQTDFWFAMITCDMMGCLNKTKMEEYLTKYYNIWADYLNAGRSTKSHTIYDYNGIEILDKTIPRCFFYSALAFEVPKSKYLNYDFMDHNYPMRKIDEIYSKDESKLHFFLLEESKFSQDFYNKYNFNLDTKMLLRIALDMPVRANDSFLVEPFWRTEKLFNPIRDSNLSRWCEAYRNIEVKKGGKRISMNFYDYSSYKIRNSI